MVNARYNKTIPVVAYATGVVVGRDGPNPVGYKCFWGVSFTGPWSAVHHLLHLRVDSITTPPTIPTKLASRIPSGPSLPGILPLPASGIKALRLFWSWRESRSPLGNSPCTPSPAHDLNNHAIDNERISSLVFVG